MKQINKSKFVLLLTLLIVMVVSFFYMKIEMSYAVFLMLSCILLFMMSKLYNIRKYYLALAVITAVITAVIMSVIAVALLTTHPIPFQAKEYIKYTSFSLALAQLLLLARSLFGGDIHTVYIV